MILLWMIDLLMTGKLQINLTKVRGNKVIIEKSTFLEKIIIQLLLKKIDEKEAYIKYLEGFIEGLKSKN